MTTTQPDLAGKTALVTGASRGIGAALALGLAKAGAHVIALARTVGGLETLDDAIKEAGGSASLITADITDREAMTAIGPTLSTRFPTLDILVLNAGTLGELAPLHHCDEKMWQSVIDTNLSANWRLLAGLHPLLEAAPAARIVCLTSRVGGAEARANWGPYAVSKAGLEMLAQTYAAENRHAGTRVAILDPGAMRTKMRAKAMPGENPQTLPSPDDLLPIFFQAIAKDYDGNATRFAMRDWPGN